MNKVANVVYAYNSKNDDELELKVGDKIEVIGFVEDGWWKGKLKGRIGVFPSNFVQIIEIGSPTAPSIISSASPTTNNTNNSNKLGLFGSKSTRNSLSSNSLNSNGNGNNNLNNNNNLIMNNTQQDNGPASGGLACGEMDPATINSSERRAKPIRGIGYGDIFAASGIKPKPLPADPITSDRLTNSGGGGGMVGSVLQKQIPKKPPPPAPTSSLVASVATAANDIANNGSNGTPTITSSSTTTATSSTQLAGATATATTTTEQAPALPPKPANQFSPHMQQHLSRPLPPLAGLQQSLAQSQQKQQVREQAKVVYAYEPENDDELAMQVGDIIDIIDKDIEDAGWWKGELGGKIGVFPDNFVKLIEVPEAPVPVACPDDSNWRQHRVTNMNQPVIPTTATPATTAISANTNCNHQAPNTTEGKLKSVFAATPKGFSKELESSLEKHNNNPASFLSLKRNKIQQQLSSIVGGSPPVAAATTTTTTATSSETSSNKSENGFVVGSEGNSSSSSMIKLSHITANRAKGPTRRPPSNVLNKRNQLESQGFIVKRDANGCTRDEPSMASLPIDSSPTSHQQSIINSSTTTTNYHDDLSLPQQQQQATGIKPSSSLDNVLDNNQAPKTSLRATQPQPALDKSKASPIAPITSLSTTTSPLSAATASTTPSTPTATTTTTTPPWMVNLRKTHAEKKRDSMNVAPVQQQEVEVVSNSNSNHTNSNTHHKAPEKSTGIIVAADQASPIIINSTQYDNLVKQISKHFTSEISELREKVKQLQNEFQTVNELKSELEVMKTELKSCQSATENQRRYIKELVNNLADERKKIAAMQDEIDRNLK